MIVPLFAFRVNTRNEKRSEKATKPRRRRGRWAGRRPTAQSAAMTWPGADGNLPADVAARLAGLDVAAARTLAGGRPLGPDAS